MLAVFATLNAAFFPAGDVLMLFAVVSIVLLLTRNWSDRAILITAVIFLLQPVEWFHCIAALINPGHTLPDLHVSGIFLRKHHLGAEGEPPLGCQCRPVRPDRRAFPFRALARAQADVQRQRRR